MQASHTSTERRWHMKEAAKLVGVGLPALYAKLRERRLFVREGVDDRNVPIQRLQEERLFYVTNHRRWVENLNDYKDCPKVWATYRGIILLQEVADEVVRERKEKSKERSRLRSQQHRDQRESEMVRNGSDRAPDRSARAQD